MINKQQKRDILLWGFGTLVARCSTASSSAMRSGSRTSLSMSCAIERLIIGITLFFVFMATGSAMSGDEEKPENKDHCPHGEDWDECPVCRH